MVNAKKAKPVIAKILSCILVIAVMLSVFVFPASAAFETHDTMTYGGSYQVTITPPDDAGPYQSGETVTFHIEIENIDGLESPDKNKSYIYVGTDPDLAGTVSNAYYTKYKNGVDQGNTSIDTKNIVTEDGYTYIKTVEIKRKSDDTRIYHFDYTITVPDNLTSLTDVTLYAEAVTNKEAGKPANNVYGISEYAFQMMPEAGISMTAQPELKKYAAGEDAVVDLTIKNIDVVADLTNVNLTVIGAQVVKDGVTTDITHTPAFSQLVENATISPNGELTLTDTVSIPSDLSFGDKVIIKYRAEGLTSVGTTVSYDTTVTLPIKKVFADDAVTTSKTAEKVDYNKFRVDLSVSTGEVAAPPTDIVFVIDISSTMTETDMAGGQSRIDAAKETAVDFVNKLEAKGGDYNYALTSFDAKSYINQEWTDDPETIKTAINNLKATSGTNIAGGLLRANQLFDSRPSGGDPVLILLSDGEPWSMHVPSRAVPATDEQKAAGYGLDYLYYDYDVTTATGGPVSLTATDGKSISVDRWQAAESEAWIAKENGYEVYTITVHGESEINELNGKIATDLDHAYLTDSDLTPIFDDIESNIGTFIINDGVVTDPMSDYINLLDIEDGVYTESIAGVVEFPEGDSITVSTDADGRRSIKWNIGNVGFNQTKTIKYFVELKDEYIDSTEYPANNPTDLTYEDINGENKVKDIDVPNVVEQGPSIVPDVVVVDYGKTIPSTPLVNDEGDFTIDGITTGAPASGVYTQDSVTLTNGVATVEGDNILYSPFKYMSSIDRVYYYVTSKTAPSKNSESTQKKFYSTVTFIPATTVYYEDNFGGSDANGGLYINYTGDWYTVSDDGTTTSGITANTDTTDRQDNGEVGQGNTPYGYDSSYADDIKFSNGSAAKATGSVSLVNGKPQFDASASFEFTGTGFDIISRTDLDCGMITVYIVDSNGKATNVPVINKGSNTLYQIPVISYTGLSYGTYTVTINVNAPVAALGITGSVFYLDAIRIYDPMGTSSADNAEFDEANAAYNADHEANAYVASIRDYILQAGKLDETETYGAVWVDTINNDYDGGGFIEQSSIKDFELTGPNEEVYLSPGYGIGFIVESTSIPDSVQLEIKVPAPLKNGATLSAQTLGESNVTNFDVTSATEMFYDISDAVVFTPTTVNGTTLYRATVILANGLPSTDMGEIVSITNIKMTYDDATSVISTDSVSDLVFDSETVEVLDETQTEAVALKASWNVYVDVFDTVYTQHQASLPEYSISSAEAEGTVKSGQTVKATVKTSRYVDELIVTDEYGSQANITNVTSSVDESKILTDEYKTAKTWNVEFAVYGSNGTKEYTVSSANGEGETAQLDVTIENPSVESIKVYSKPDKMSYYYGESFDPTGMTLLITYSDSTTKIIDSGYSVSPEKFTKTGSQKVTVTYGGKETTLNVKVRYSLYQVITGILGFGWLWK